MQKIMIGLAVAFTAAAITTSASADDRPATPAERAEIGSILRANGYTSWRRIEFDRDDRKFEVDDARHANGGVYDIDIRGGNIIKRERE
ncbi:PepSY domain-containing protein [uncultured Hyphomicrobium sp.]|uniref:PepSY domain-containing protein n=1 Tax=uncultured Hyphomicrobium sp. TaxID=194373 RepID=UPI0025DF8AA2|nr:PepSY domain-containing protein [uncultured Hyphomicrobium sp.]